MKYIYLYLYYTLNNIFLMNHKYENAPTLLMKEILILYLKEHERKPF